MMWPIRDGTGRRLGGTAGLVDLSGRALRLRVRPGDGRGALVPRVTVSRRLLAGWSRKPLSRPTSLGSSRASRPGPLQLPEDRRWVGVEARRKDIKIPELLVGFA